MRNEEFVIVPLVWIKRFKEKMTNKINENYFFVASILYWMCSRTVIQIFIVQPTDIFNIEENSNNFTHRSSLAKISISSTSVSSGKVWVNKCSLNCLKLGSDDSTEAPAPTKKTDLFPRNDCNFWTSLTSSSSFWMDWTTFWAIFPLLEHPDIKSRSVLEQRLEVVVIMKGLGMDNR